MTTRDEIMGLETTDRKTVDAITRLGLTGVTSTELFEAGIVRSCRLNERNELLTSCGTLVPRFGPETIRNKNVASVSFDRDGLLKAVYLEKQQEITTSLGSYPAEFVMFYPSGALKAFFPVNGKITGFWTQKDEGELCPKLDFRVSCGAFSAKVSCVRFYESGALRSMTLWPGENVLLRTNQGPLPARFGFALFEDGTLESVEPPYPIAVETPVGVIEALDCQAIGITGDVNSLSFWEDGSMHAVTTSHDRIDVIEGAGKTTSYAPAQVPNPLLENKTMVSPLHLSFDRLDGKRSIHLSNGVKEGSYELASVCFRVFTGTGESTESIRNTSQMSCGDCASCNLECSAHDRGAH